MQQETIDAAARAAQAYGIPLPNLLACIEVESNGVIFATIHHPDGTLRHEPIIRWEGHYFDQRVISAKRDEARRKGLSSPYAGKIANPSSQQARWDKLFYPAALIDTKAAIESCSWGVGQVMGAHWQRLGYPTPQDFLTTVRTGVEGQIEVMLRYCKAFGLIEKLKRGDFAGFARGYNGANYRKYSYDTKMAAAARRYAGQAVALTDATVSPVPIVMNVPTAKPDATVAASSMIRMGTEGAKVREVQELLRRAGYAIDVDGDFGPATESAVRSFQGANGLEVDGVVGPKTWQALDAGRVDPAEKPGVPSIPEAIVGTPQGRQGLGGVMAGLGLETVNGTIQQATDKLQAYAGTYKFAGYLFVGLTATSAVLAIGGGAWALYGWWRANTTRGVSHAAAS